MPTVPLIQLKQGCSSQIHSLIPQNNNDLVVTRLQDLGFVRGALIQMIAHTPFKQGPCVVKIGMTRFALRFQEASRILVSQDIVKPT